MAPLPAIPDTRASFFLPTSSPSDAVILRMRHALTAALRLPAAHRWVADWLFAASSTPYHPDLTVPPSAFAAALAVRVTHDLPPSAVTALAADHHFVGLPHPSQSSAPGDRDAYILLVPVACLHGLTVGYSFGRATGPFATRDFPNFVGRFVFDPAVSELLIVSPEFAGGHYGILSVSMEDRDHRCRSVIIVPREQYGFHRLPSQPIFMISNDEIRVADSSVFQFDVAPTGTEDHPAHCDGHGRTPNNDTSSSHASPCDELMQNDDLLLSADSTADVLAADEFAPSLTPLLSGFGPTQHPLHHIPPVPSPMSSPDDQFPFVDHHQGQDMLFALQGTQVPCPRAAPLDIEHILDAALQDRQDGSNLPVSLLQGMAGASQGHNMTAFASQLLKNGGKNGPFPLAASDTPADRFARQNVIDNHANWTNEQTGLGQQAEEPPPSSTAPSISEDTSLSSGPDHLSGVIAADGSTSDDDSRTDGESSSNAGAFDMSTLTRSLATLERSLKGSFYGKRAQHNILHPLSGKAVARVMDGLRATLEGPDPIMRQKLQEAAMHSYYASVLAVDPDVKLRSGLELIWKRRAEDSIAVRSPIMNSMPVVNAQDAEAVRAEKRRIRREKNRLSAARSNEKRRERLEAQRTELVDLRQRLDILRGKKTVMEEENAALKESLMRRGGTVASSEGV